MLDLARRLTSRTFLAPTAALAGATAALPVSGAAVATASTLTYGFATLAALLAGGPLLHLAAHRRTNPARR